MVFLGTDKRLNITRAQKGRRELKTGRSTRYIHKQHKRKELSLYLEGTGKSLKDF